MTIENVPHRSRYFVAELKCYWCGAVAGTLEGSWPTAAAALKFRPRHRLSTIYSKRLAVSVHALQRAATSRVRSRQRSPRTDTPETSRQR